MQNQNEKLLDDGTMAADYILPTPERIKVSVSLMDELTFPIERRGYATNIPHNVDDRASVAKAIGELVERTARVLMGLSAEEAS